MSIYVNKVKVGQQLYAASEAHSVGTDTHLILNTDEPVIGRYSVPLISQVVISPDDGSQVQVPDTDSAMVGWDVSVTTKRLILWTALSSGVFGGTKTRTGVATTGWVNFDDIGFIRVSQGPKKDQFVVVIVAWLGDRSSNIRFITRFFGTRDELAPLLRALCDAMVSLVVISTCKANPEIEAEKLTALIREQPDSFAEHCWECAPSADSNDENDLDFTVQSQGFPLWLNSDTDITVYLH